MALSSAALKASDETWMIVVSTARVESEGWVSR